ncbi:MAG: hypothetical protein ABIG20_00145 [archaeon]
MQTDDDTSTIVKQINTYDSSFVTLGDGAVGKTDLWKKFLDPNYDPRTLQYSGSTHMKGVVLKNKKFSGGVMYQCDTMGQREFLLGDDFPAVAVGINALLLVARITDTANGTKIDFKTVYSPKKGEGLNHDFIPLILKYTRQVPVVIAVTHLDKIDPHYYPELRPSSRDAQYERQIQANETFRAALGKLFEDFPQLKSYQKKGLLKVRVCSNVTGYNVITDDGIFTTLSGMMEKSNEDYKAVFKFKKGAKKSEFLENVHELYRYWRNDDEGTKVTLKACEGKDPMTQYGIMFRSLFRFKESFYAAEAFAKAMISVIEAYSQAVSAEARPGLEAFAKAIKGSLKAEQDKNTNKEKAEAAERFLKDLQARTM